MQVQRIHIILQELEEAINSNKPFSLIRFGDGGIKLIHSLFYNDEEQLQKIVLKEGIPREKVVEILALWGIYANKANYIDTPEVYFSNEFWGRYKNARKKKISDNTIKRLKMWRELYHRCGIKIDKVKYCNPEASWLSILRLFPYRNLLDIMKGKKICCISTYNYIPKLSKKYQIKYHRIVPHFENQYENSFNQTIEFINKNANNYDLWLNSSGELGRIYSGLIKDLGGRVFDTGFVIDYFVNEKIHPRLQRYIQKNPKDSKEIVLTRLGYRYKDTI